MLSTAEYACPVWARSRHNGKLDAVINRAMRTIIGCMRFTPAVLLSVLAGLEPMQIWRVRCCQRLAVKALEPEHLLHEGLNNLPQKHLKPRVSLIDNANLAPDPNFPSEYVTSQRYGQLQKFIRHLLKFSPHTPGCDLPRKIWVRLNRVRTACTKTYGTQNRFGPRRSLNCDCGHPRQTLDHLMKCPLVTPVVFGDL